MIRENVTQIASIQLNTYEVTMVIRGLERVDTQDGKHLKEEFENLYHGMTGKTYGVK